MKNNELLFAAVGELPAEMIPALKMSKTRPRKTVYVVLAAVLGAAAVFGVIGGALFGRGHEQGSPLLVEPRIYPSFSYTQNTDPTEKIDIAGRQGEGEGESLLMLYSPAQQIASPPRLPADITALPVLKRKLEYTDGYGPGYYYTKEQMFNLGRAAAKALDVNVLSEEAENENGLPQADETERVSLVQLTCENDIRIIVMSCGEIQICFDQTVSLPPEYTFTFFTSTENAEASVRYLTERYAALLQMEDPVLEIRSDATFNGLNTLHVVVHESSSDPVRNLLDYSLTSVFFSPAHNRSDGMEVIRLYNAGATAEYVADYPIITEDAAKQKLLEQGYMHFNGDGDLMGTYDRREIPVQDICGCELGYALGAKYIYPVYRFLVEVHEDEGAPYLANNLRTFKWFSVPAVREDFILETASEDAEIPLNR